MAHQHMNQTGKSRNVRSILSWIWPYRIVRIALAVLFIYGGVTKLFDPKAFARIIDGYGLVPEALLPVVAIGLPVIETIAGVGLLLEIRGSLAAVAALLGMFVCVLGYGVSLNLDVDCGCFGAEELAKRSGLRLAFLRDLILGGIVVPYLYLSRRLRSGMVPAESVLPGETDMPETDVPADNGK